MLISVVGSSAGPVLAHHGVWVVAPPRGGRGPSSSCATGVDGPESGDNGPVWRDGTYGAFRDRDKALTITLRRRRAYP